MSESISSGADKLYIKLFNGKSIDLNALNNLVDKECNNSVFLNWESKNGDGNSIFSNEEINLLKTQLYQKYVDDEQLSQEDLDDIFGKNADDESIVTQNSLHKSFQELKGKKPSLELEEDTSSEKPEQTPEPENPNPEATVSKEEPERDENKIYTNYIIQNGDTPQKIVAKFKLQGEEAKKVLDELNEALGNRKYFMIGEVVKISGDYQQKIAEMSDYKTDINDIEKDYKKDKAKKAAAKEKTKKTSEGTKSKQPQIPGGVQAYINKLKNKNFEYKLNKNNDGSYSIIQKSGFNNPNITETVRKYDKSGHLISHTQTYKNGEVRRFQYDKNGKESVKSLIRANGDVLIGMPNSEGKITSLKKMLTLKDNKSEISVTRHNDGSFDIVEKRNDFAKEGIVSKIYKFDKTGKHFKNIVVIKPKQKAKTQSIKPFWADNHKQQWQPNPISPAKSEPQKESETKASGTDRSSKTGQKQNTQKEKSLSQASLIPGFEGIGSNPLRPKTTEEFIKYISTNEYKYPEKMRYTIAELRAAGVECKNITKNINGSFSMTLDDSNCTLAQYNSNLYTNTVVVFDSNGNLLQVKNNNNGLGFSQTTGYKDGKAVKNDNSFSLRTGYSALDEQRSYDDNVPIDIHISIPEHYKDDNDVKEFAGSLEKYKADLMNTLGITNEQYDRLANIAMGIAENEKHFNNYVITDTKGNKHLTGWRRLKKDTATVVGLLDGPNHSWGITQINWTQNMEGDQAPAPYLRQVAKQFGITSYKDYKDNPEKAAILTMIILNNKRIYAEGSTWQERLAKNNAMIDADKSLTEEEKARKKVTTDDIIALQYNGMGAITKRFDDPNQYVTIDDDNSGLKDKNGNIIKDGLSYAKNVRAYRKEFFTVNADKNSKARVSNLSADTQTNYGKIGSVIFMPRSYKNEKTATPEDIALFEKVMTRLISQTTNSKYKQKLTEIKAELVQALQNGDFKFGYGLTEEEADSITTKDVELLVKNLKELKSKVDGLSESEVRQLAKTTNDNFQSEYLQSRQVVVNDSDVNRDSIIYGMRYAQNVDQKSDDNRRSNVKKAHLNGKQQGHAAGVAVAEAASEADGYRHGFMVEKDKGVNPYDSNGNYIPDSQRKLAEYGSVVSRDMGTGGNCLTGVKLALENMGVVKKGEIVYPKGHPKAGQPIKHAKDLKLFFDAHPDKFQQVKYISIGSNKSREINASDIRNLPAGYIGIFIPGPGFEDQSGHAFITNGNGQGYSDEVDNLRWDDFKSDGNGNGKGEHGKFVIYKLKI